MSPFVRTLLARFSGTTPFSTSVFGSISFSGGW